MTTDPLVKTDFRASESSLNASNEDTRAKDELMLAEVFSGRGNPPLEPRIARDRLVSNPDVPSRVFVYDLHPVIPTPPILDTETEGTDGAWAMRVMRWYEAYYLLKVRKRCWVFRAMLEGKKSFTETPAWSTLRKSVEAFRKARISPVHWIKWQWDYFTEKDRAAFCPWYSIFIPAHIEKRGGWCRKEMADYGVGVSIKVPEVEAFAEKQARMWIELERLGASATDQQVTFIARGYFPTHAHFAIELSTAQEKCRKLAAAISKRIDNGEWVWDER